jgi:hypothetical protein
MESVNGLSQRKRTLSTPGNKKIAGSQVGIQSGGMARKGNKEENQVERVEVEKPKAKIGRPRKVVPIEDRKKALRAAEIGIPLERVAILCGFPSGNAGPWHAYLKANPDFAQELERARLEGELDMSCVVRTAGPGWQGSAWLLERTRGYVARAQLEHTGKGGKELSVSGALLGAFGGSK